MTSPLSSDSTVRTPAVPATSATATSRFLPISWLGFAATLVLVPLIFRSDASLSFLSQIGTLIVFGLSYNMLLGQGGMLSFGHAIYSGLGGYLAIHVMNASAAHSGIFVPLVLIPLVGGLGGLLFGALLGYITTKKAGTTFAMITMGLGELVYTSTQMFPRFFGGDGGITTNRSYDNSFFGLTFGSSLQVYYLIATWVMLCTIAMYAFTQTPLGRISNAVRDNPERVEFIGYDTRKVRYLVLMASSFFAGLSGALACINFEIAGAESVSAAASGNGLLFTFIGGSGSFVGPVLGAIAGGLLATKLSDFTMAWQFYLGVFFILFVMFCPSGLAGIFESNWRVLRARKFGQVAAPWCAVVGASGLVLVGAVIVVELSYAAAFGSQKAATAAFLTSLSPVWNAMLLGAGVALLVGGTALLAYCRRSFRERWSVVMAHLSDQPNGTRP